MASSVIIELASIYVINSVILLSSIISCRFRLYLVSMVKVEEEYYDSIFRIS